MAEDFNSGLLRTNPKLPERDSNPERPDCEFDALTTRPTLVRDLSEISRRGEGVGTEGGSQLFETAEKGRVMKNGPLKGGGSCKYVSVIM